MKIGFIFAGQGQQFLYMGQDLVKEYDIAQNLYTQAHKVLGYDVLHLDKEKLNQTKYTQVALFVLSCVLNDILKDKGIKPNVVAGLSLGEYNALYSAEVFDFETGLKLIQKRAKLMHDAFEPYETGMAACLRTDRDTITKVLENTEIEICNVNTPSQIVIGGNTAKLDEVLVKLKKEKIRAIKLRVSSVSHMSLLKNESEKLKDILTNVSFNKPRFKFINNVEAKFQTEHFEDTLARQISENTELALSIQKMIDEGIDTILE
ncbi:MAG TPA: ACP S-malonyltransferase, partial [Erysipelothrix sp.]|nr:ACP S-malonyltransferase [Erysipelothrix sp.]